MLTNSVRREGYISDEQRMEDDIWQLADFDLLRESSKAIQNKMSHCGLEATTIDFASIKNTKIKEEIKAYYRHVVLTGRRSIATLQGGIFVIRKIISYINQLNIKESLLECSYEDVYYGFRKFMEIHQLTTYDVIRSVSKEQQKKIYVVDNPSMNEMKCIYHFLQERQVESLPEEEKDIWDIRNLPILVEPHCSRPRYQINFTNIKQPAFRKIVKKYVFERLKIRKLSCVYDDMKALNMFSGFLLSNHSEIDSLKDITRSIIEEYFAYIDQLDYALTTKQQRKGFLRTFFELSFYLELGEVPEAKIIFRDDYRKKIKVIPRIISQKILDQLNAHLDEVPIETANITRILENIGMRINEVCQLKNDCLKKDSEGYSYLEYYQSKSRHYNRVPISKEIVEILLEQIKRTKEKYPQSDYVFAQDETRPYAQENFSYHINRMAYRHKIMDDTGKLFRFKSHLFRHTVATKYANAGMSPNMIRAMLGHKSLRSIMSYVEIRDVMANEKMVDFFRCENEHLKAWTNSAKEIETDKGTLLSNGYCMKGGDLCETALLCYSCGMFYMDALDQTYAEKYLSAVRKKLSEAKYMGLERQIELYGNMENIVKKALARKGDVYGQD